MGTFEAAYRFNPKQRPRRRLPDEVVKQPPTFKPRVGLLDLPQEIRAEIYKFLLPTAEHCGYQTDEHSRLLLPIPHPITRVCQLIREESLKRFYTIVRVGLLGTTLRWECKELQTTALRLCSNSLRLHSYASYCYVFMQTDT